MRSSDDLFQLIKSLDKTEKRYFRLFSSLQSGDKKYMRVFDAIAKQKNYDEKQITEIFGENGLTKQFPVVKHYLYNLILSCLESYHTNIESELYSHLHRVAILYEKRLYVQCTKVIIKAKQLAVKYDLPLPLLELMKWEVKLINMQSFIGATEDRVKEIFNSISISIEQYKTSNDYFLHSTLLFLKDTKTGNIRSRSDIKELKMIMDNPLFRPSKVDELSFQSLLRFYSVYGMYFSLQHDYEKANTFRQKQIQLLEENPHQITENPLRYAQIINNFFGSTLYLKKYQECTDIIEKLKKMQVKLPNIKKHIDFLKDEMSLSLCIETGSFNEALPLIKSMEDKWDNKDSMMIFKGKILTFQYNAAYTYFAIGNYSKSNEYLNKILNEPIDTRNDIQYFAGILSLIVYFEMGNQDLLEYRVKSIHRFLYKRKRLNKTENIILEFIRKELPKIHSKKALIKSFEVLLTKRKAIANVPFKRKALDYFDFISWLESKIEGKPFAEVVREKVSRQ